MTEEKLDKIDFMASDVSLSNVEKIDTKMVYILKHKVVLITLSLLLMMFCIIGIFQSIKFLINII